MFTDEYYMRLALGLAREAAAEGEIPVGAVLLTPQGEILARTHNECERLGDVTAHAEVLAIGAAASGLGYKLLTKCTLYVTLEPCPMCASALYWAQLGRLVYGASDAKRGCMLFSPSLLHPRTSVTAGVLAEESAELMRTFFRARR